MPEAVEKRLMRRERCGVFRGRDGREAGWSIGAGGLSEGYQVLIASISGPTPRIVIIRLRL